MKYHVYLFPKYDIPQKISHYLGVSTPSFLPIDMIQLSLNGLEKHLYTIL